MTIADDTAPDAQPTSAAEKETPSDETTEIETGDEDTGDDEGDSKTENATDEGDEDNADGEAKDGDEDGDQGDDEGEEPEPKPKKPSRSDRYKARIARLEAQLRDTSSRSGGSLADADVAAEVEKQIGKPPDEKDFKGDFIGFERAMNAYEVDKRQTTREVRKEFTNANARRAEEFAELVEDHVERVNDFSTKVKDFKDVVTKAAKAGAQVSKTVESLVLESDKSAHLVYYLAKNSNVVEKLNGMTEREAAREIGRIESRLSLPQPNKQTKARTPVAPLRGGAAVVSPEAGLDAWLARKYGKK